MGEPEVTGEPEVFYVVCMRVVDRGEPPKHPAVTALCRECRAKVYLAKSSIPIAKKTGKRWAAICLPCTMQRKDDPVIVVPIAKQQLDEVNAEVPGAEWTAKDAEAAVLRMLPNARMRGD